MCTFFVIKMCFLVGGNVPPWHWIRLWMTFSKSTNVDTADMLQEGKAIHQESVSNSPWRGVGVQYKQSVMSPDDHSGKWCSIEALTLASASGKLGPGQWLTRLAFMSGSLCCWPFSWFLSLLPGHFVHEHFEWNWLCC